MNNVQQRITEWSAKRRVRQMRDRILALLLTVMMIAGMFASVMPAVAAEEAFCGLEEHTHSDDCYKENRELICELPESLHVHTDACYAETRVLKCGQIETEGHIHTDDCYEERTTYMCGLEEYEGHTHTDGCYTEQTCLVCDNTDPEHEHDESCYITESVLTCGIPESEGHTHTDGCLGVEKVLVCGLEEHDPHTHDDTCYTTEIVLSCGLEEGEPEHVHTEDCYKITRELICEQAEHVHTSACFEDASTEMPVFSQSKTVDDVVVSVTAPEGVFPAEATLSVTKVPVQAQTMVDAAVEAERSENVNVAVSYTFDIKVLDAEGYELQPAEGQGVNVSFTLAAAQDSNLKASVYHVDESGASAVLDAETQGGTVTAATDGFSYYTVEFTYQNLQYVLSGGGSVALDTVLSTVGLTGEVANAYGSNDSLFSVSNSTGEWIVTSHEAFDSTESLMVLINGVEYVITVTDDNTWAGGTIKLEFGFASSADRHVQYSNYDPSVPWENNDNHPWFTYHSWGFLPYWPGSATLYNSAGRVVESYTNETRHEFKNLPAGEYTIKLDSLDEGIYSIYQGVHNGAPRSQIIIWSEDSPLLKVTVREGDTANILRWVVLEYKVYGFKTVTDVGTFGPAANTATPGQPSADGKEYVYYGGGSWGVEDYPNPETYIPYVQTKDGIYWGDHASQYRGMGSLQIPTLSDAEAARGYVFKGWKLEGDDSGKIYTDLEARNYTVKGNVVFRAVWELPQCTVTFDPNGGAGNMDSVTVSTGSYTLPENGFTAPEGMAFNGWDRGSAGSNINISENITLLAQWAEDANGDDIPDNKQVLIKYVAGANGSYTGDEYDVFTAVGDEVSIDNVASTGRTAVPNTDYALDKWSNSKNSDTNQTGAFTFGTVDVDTIITVTASFADDNAHASAWAEGSIGIEFGWVSPDSYRTAMLNPRGAFMGWASLPYWSNGAAELLDSAGNTLGSFTGESSHKFTGLKAGKYILRVTPLKPDSVYNAVESITGVSVITDYETEIEIAEGAVGTIWKYVVVEYKAYAFKTTTEIGTFASGGQAHVYYPGGNWAYENTDPASVSRCATFNTHDGIYYKDTASQYNLSVLEIPTLSEEEAAKGYKFVGWKLVENGDLSEKIYTDVEALSYVVRGDTEFRAVWEYPTHTVSFSTNADCGAINGDTSVSFQMNYNNQTMEGEGIALPEVIVKPGYEFIGWYSDLTTNVIPNETILKTKVDRDLNYYAKYKGSEFTVKYLPGTDGSITSNFDELRLANGTYIPSVPTVKANTGASFTGKWKVVAISDGAALHVGDVLDESDIKAIAVSFDMNFEAQYEKENLTVAFDSDGGTPVDSQNVLSGDKADKPNDPTKDGYTFNGWTLDGREYDFDAPVIENITLVAKWIANTDTGYVVEFYYQSGGEYGTQPDKSEVRSGTTDTEVSVTDADKTPDPAKTGFVLDEVMNDFYTGSINGDGTLVLKVYFKQQFTVVYDPGEHGTWAAADKTISGIDYGKPTPSFSGDTSAQHDAGYTFSGWTPSVADTVTMDVTYVAQWTANEGSQYTVEYYYQENGTYPATASSSVSRTGDVGTEVSITDEDKAPSRSGYAIDETLNDFFTGTVADDGSLVLKVYFKQQFTVVYEPGAHGTWEAASATTEKLNYGVATPAFSGNVSSDHDAGYHFVSWTPSVADTVTANAVYVAQWAADSETRYKVEYYYQVNGVYPQTANKSVDRTGITDKTVQVTATDKTPDRNGYALDNAAANVLSGIVAADGSLVLKVYFKQQFTITYNMNGGTMNGSTASVKETHDYGEVISILKAPTRSGYTFQYWKGSEYQPGENYTVTGDHTFTAQWSANSAKLPKTGQTTWPIPVFTVMGTALIVYGLIRRKKEEKENAS